MFSKGYRTTTQTPHLAVILFLRTTFSKQLGILIDELDRMRRKRHVTIYDISGGVSDSEVEHALEAAEQFLDRVRTIFS